MGGIGKTTLARVVFHMVLDKFEGCCFLANVREVCEKYGLVRLQQQLILQLLNENMSVQDVNEGLLVIKNRLRHKRILLVLDDVDQLDQLNKLAGNQNWFGLGSRVIITTRDKHLLQILGVDEIYEANLLTHDESLHLFGLKAFRKDHPPEDYLELSEDFVYYADGLPLAIEILGSFLFGRSTNQWKSALNRLKQFPEKDVLQVLRISFEGLHETEKEIFLNIACFFNHRGKNDVVEILNYLGLFPDVGLGVLFDKSLVKFRDHTLWMHDLLQKMGENIVYEECPKEPGKRSKLWLFKDINDVLIENTGTKAIQGIVLKLNEQKEAYWNPECFSKAHDLKLLILDDVHLLHEPKYLPNALRFLDWSGYPSKHFPSSFQQKPLDSLKFIQLKNSPKLIETLDFNKIPNLEKLVLKDCTNLRSLHLSIGVCKKLTFLNLKGCKNLKSLPRKFEMESLEILILSGCSSLKRIPELGENMESVLELYLDGTAITELPTSIENLTRLASLNVEDCKNLMSLPSTFFNMKWLKDLNLSGCSRLIENLVIQKSVEEVDASGIAAGLMPYSNALFQTLKKLAFGGFKPRIPNCMCLFWTSFLGLGSLTSLDLSYCNLNAIPNDICCLFSLTSLNLSGNNFSCLPESFAQLSILKRLKVNNCTSLRSWPKLPLNIVLICGIGCTSLETLPDPLQPNSLYERGGLILSNCQAFIDNLFVEIIKSLWLPLSGMLPRYAYDIVIPGSEIPKWFTHQSIGAELSIPEQNDENECMGIAICYVFCCLPHHQVHKEYCRISCWLIVNGTQVDTTPSFKEIVPLSDHIWLLYLPKSLCECDANVPYQIDIIIESHWESMIPIMVKVKKCGLRMVYKKDIEDLYRTMAKRNNNSITPYEGSDVPHHNFGNSMVAGSSNYEPLPNKLERYMAIISMAQDLDVEHHSIVYSMHKDDEELAV
ncbi:disease resistance-like protein DSC1 [Quercus suber]|uniref:disease resistance-like protein DSC1 n=1 Tax=Quercus suber TaxID=58331 RepID=UPI0032DFC9F0